MGDLHSYVIFITYQMAYIFLTLLNIKIQSQN